MYGWNDLKNSMDSIYTADVNHGFMKSNASIICNKWFPAAHLDYYVARPLHKNLLVWGDTSDIHQYAWINPTRKAINKGDDAYCIVPSNNYFDPKEFYKARFDSIQSPAVVNQKRCNMISRRFYIYKMKGYK
jgi:hypothetical protein